MIDEVRQRVLELISEQPDHLFDNKDIDCQIRYRDGLIKMFCKQSVDDHNCHDIESICQRLLETMKWRKSYGIVTSKMSDFPLEFWTRKHFMYFEDDKYFIGIYDMSSIKKVSQRWNDVMQRFIHYVHNNYCLEAVHAGKKVIMMTDSTNAGIENVNHNLDAENMRILDTHFPCLSEKIGVYGVPWLISGMCSVFVKLYLPYSLKKRFRIYTRDSIKDAYPNSGYVPSLFGGKLTLNPLVKDMTSIKGFKNLREYGASNNFDDWEIEKQVQFYKS